MDALVKLLIDEYKMSPDEASKYAAIIHERAANPTGMGKGIDSEYGNPDHLQTQAYDKVAKDEIANMDRLRKRALFFTNIARARANGHVLSPDAEAYYQQVMDLHKKSVAQHGKDTIQQYGKTQQYLANRQHEVELGPARAELGGQDIRNQANHLSQQYGVIRQDPSGYLSRQGDLAGQQGQPGAAFASGLRAPQQLYDATNQIAADSVPQTPEQLADLQRYYNPNVDIGDVTVTSLPRRK
jgi:hypothetical protein